MADDNEIWMLCTNTAVRRAARRLGQLYDDIIEPSGLKGTQFSLLSQIARHDEPALKSLAEAMVMDLSALGHTLKPLIRDGYVELVPDDKDRRVKRARLTAAGLAKQRETTLLWQKAQAQLDEVFGQQQSLGMRQALAELSSADFAERFKKAGDDGE
ncbi:MarR family protein [compost metagenome]